MATDIRVQKVLEEQARLLNELSEWRTKEELKSGKIRKKCLEILNVSSDLTSPNSVVEVFKLFCH